MCVAVDSNSLHAMQVERLSEVEGEATAALDAILQRSYIALDSGKICMQEWLECMPGPFGEEVKAWVDDLIVRGKLRFLEVDTCEVIAKACLGKGLPKPDLKWIKLCAHKCVQYLVTEDIDFFEPKLKASSSKAKQSTKDNLSGGMRKLIKKSTGVEVICLKHVPDMI